MCFDIYREENISLFRDLESHAVNMEKVSSASVTFANLMEELLIHQLSDLEKVCNFNITFFQFRHKQHIGLLANFTACRVIMQIL